MVFSTSFSLRTLTSSSSVVAAASMMNTTLFRRLCAVGASLVNSNLCCKLLVIQPFHFRNVFSTEAHFQTLFSNFASSKLNLSEADITRMFKLQPQLQNLRTLDNVEKFIQSLKKRGCTEVQITNILRLKPQLVGIPEKTLEANLQLLEDFGFVGQKLPKLLTKNAYLLCMGLENNLLHTMEFLRNVFQSKEVLIKALSRAPRLRGCRLEKTLKPSLAFWEGWGFSGAALVSFLLVDPRVLTRTSLTPAQVDLISKIGADKDSELYKYIVSRVAVSCVKTLYDRLENLKLCGLTAEETWQVLGAAPVVFCYSKKNVSEKMSFRVNNMELPVHSVVKHPCLLQVNLEKTMRPRFLVWQKIKSINDTELPLLTLLTMSKKKFFNSIIKGHAESKILWTIYENAISNTSTVQRAHQNELLHGENES